MSMTTTSGRSDLHLVTASRPLAASATTVHPCCNRIEQTPLRKISWSSATSTLRLFIAASPKNLIFKTLKRHQAECSENNAGEKTLGNSARMVVPEALDRSCKLPP